MRRSVAVFFSVVALVIGLASGFVLRGALPLSRSSLRSAAADKSTLHADVDNTTLVTSALMVLDALQEERYTAITDQIHPELGLTFTPFSTVDTSTNLTFTPKEYAAALSDTTSYIWGVAPDSNEPIRTTLTEYLREYVWDADYTSVSDIGVDKVLYTGNAVENVETAYEGCRYVDFYYPSTDEENHNWSSLKLVFSWYQDQWYLVGIINSSWVP